LESIKELPPVAEALKRLAAALKAASEPGLDAVEIQRLNTVATLARAYESMLARFMQYREIEKRLVELECQARKRGGRGKGLGRCGHPSCCPN